MNREQKLELALDRVRRCVSYPVSTEIDPKGWGWYVAPDAPEVIMETIDAALSAPKAEAVEPVAEAGAMPGASGFTMACFRAEDVPIGTPLYASPVPALTAGEEAGGVKVKALEWKRYRDGDADAVTPFGDVYTAYAGGYWRITERGKAGKFIRAGFDTASAKAAAQADYERRILSALEPTPSPIVDDAMVERAILDRFGPNFYNQTKEVQERGRLEMRSWINAALSGARE